VDSDVAVDVAVLFRALPTRVELPVCTSRDGAGDGDGDGDTGIDTGVCSLVVILDDGDGETATPAGTRLGVVVAVDGDESSPSETDRGMPLGRPPLDTASGDGLPCTRPTTRCRLELLRRIMGVDVAAPPKRSPDSTSSRGLESSQPHTSSSRPRAAAAAAAASASRLACRRATHRPMKYRHSVTAYFARDHSIRARTI
jgi:hypothetical protein